MKPFITIMMAVYNPNDHLSQALESILNQTYSNFELLIIDDGSDSESLVKAYLPDDPRIRYIRQKNQGVAGARNTGLKNAKGELIAFIDQDDFWRLDKLELQVNCLMETEADFIYCNIDMVDSKNKILEKNKSRLHINESIDREDQLLALLEGNFIYSAAPLIRRSCFDVVGDFDVVVEPHDDWDMWLRIAKNGFILKGVNEPLGSWRVHDENQSKKRLLLMYSTRVDVLEKVFKSDVIKKKYGKIKEFLFHEANEELAVQHYRKGQMKEFRSLSRDLFKSSEWTYFSWKIARKYAKSYLKQVFFFKN